MQSQIELKFQRQWRQLTPIGRQRFLIGAIAALSTVVGEVRLAEAASLTNWNFDPGANQLEITVKDGTTPRYFLMAQPARIVVDLPDTAIGDVSAQKTYSGVVRQIRVSQFEPGLTRIVMEISPGVSLAPGQVKLQKVGDRATQAGNSRWVLRPLIAQPTNTVTVPPSSMPSTRPAASIANVPDSSTIAPAPTAPGNRPLLQPQPAVENLPPPPAGSSQPMPTNVAMAGDQPATNNPTPTPSPTTSVVSAGISTTTAPTPVALAPVLPSPAPNAGTTPLPPPSTNLIDPNVAIDTSSGVAIAVPSPTASTNVAPQATATTGSTDAMPRSTSRVASGSRVASDSRVASGIESARTQAPGVVPATPAPIVPTDNRSQSALAQVSSAPDLATADVPMTLAVRPLMMVPSVSVPPLSDRVQTERVQTEREAVSASRSDSPVRSGQSATAELSVSPTSSNSQPAVSVLPPIQVGTPSLGLSANTPMGVAASPDAASTSVSVPPLQSLQIAPSTPSSGASTTYDANTIRQSPGATPLTGVAGTAYDANTVRQQPFSTSNLAPPLQAPLQSSATPSIASPTYDASTVRQAAPSPSSSPIVFGQPLPATVDGASNGQPLASVNQSPGVRQAFNPMAPNVLLPTGTTFNLRYPGNTALSLRPDRPQQEVLVLQADLRDQSGKLLAPAGSLVTGQFQTTTAGSQFVTQAIALTGRSLPLAAQSDALDGTRQVANSTLARNSGIGILAGGLLGAIGGSTGLGAIGGAAAGAATTLITAPKPAMIQPGQIVQVRLTQDLSSAE